MVIDGKKTSIEDNRLFGTFEELKGFFNESFDVELKF